MERTATTQDSREWFVDDRDGDRRMQVSWHRDRRLVILSLWNGHTCTSSFRLPVEDAPQMIRLLADGLGEAASMPAQPVAPASAPTMLQRLRRLLRPPLAEIVQLGRSHVISS